MTAHAGRKQGPRVCGEPCGTLGVERIGHGVRLLRTRSVEYLVDHQIPLEVCPTSNLRTGVVADWEAHPARTLIQSGALVTINTDDPAMFDVSLAEEFEPRASIRTRRAALKRLSLAVVEGSWADDETRSNLTRLIEDWWALG